MTNPAGPRARVSLEGLQQSSGSAAVESNVAIHFPVNVAVNSSNLGVAQRDCEMLLEKMRTHPDEFAQLFDTVAASDLRRAVRIAQSIGITEDDFQREGGGFLPVLVGAAVVLAVVLWASDAS